MAADIIDYKIYGDDMQVVEVELDPGEGIRAEAGTMMYMDADIEMQTGTGGGMFQGFKRLLTGESFFITTFLHTGAGKATISFSAPYPGKIIPLDSMRQCITLIYRNCMSNTCTRIEHQTCSPTR